MESVTVTEVVSSRPLTNNAGLLEDLTNPFHGVERVVTWKIRGERKTGEVREVEVDREDLLDRYTELMGKFANE